MESEITLTDWHAAPEGDGEHCGGDGGGGWIWEHRPTQGDDVTPGSAVGRLTATGSG